MMIRNKVILITLASLSYVWAGSADAPLPLIRQCDERRINEHMRQLQDEHSRNATLRFVLKGSGAAAMVTACVMIWRDFSIISGDDLRSVQLELATLAAKVAHIEGGEIKVKKIGSSWGALLGRLAAHMFVSSCLNYLTQKFIAPIFREHTLAAFMQECTTLPLLEKELFALKADIDHLHGAKDALLAAADLNRYEKSILGLYRSTVMQLERLIAYIRLTLRRLSVKELIAAGCCDAENAVQSYIAAAARLLEREQAYEQSLDRQSQMEYIQVSLQAIEQLFLQVKSAVAQFELAEKQY